MAESRIVEGITLLTDESKVAGPKELLMSSPFAEFKGSPIDWDNIGNMSAISEIAMRFRPDQIRDQIRTSRIDPNDLLTVAGTLIELSFRDHGKVALEEAIRQLDANPTRIAADIDIVAAKRNLCFLLEDSRDSLAQFELIKKEPKIVQADPKLAVAVAEGLISKGRFEEAAVVFAGIDQVPFEVLAEKLAGISGAIEGVNALRVEAYKHARWSKLPGWWDDIGPGDVRRIIPAVEQNLQRRVGMGHDDTLLLIRQLAVTGDRRAIPVLKQALRHHKSNVRTDAALALHAVGDSGGLEALISGFHSGEESDRWKFANALECIRSPRATTAVAEYNAAKRASEELKQRRINEGLCLTCGKALGFMDKMSGRQIHKQCS